MLLVRRTGILLYRAIRAFYADTCTQRAAALSFYVLFSLFPLIIFSVGILGLVLRDAKLQTDVVNQIMENIPLSPDKGRDDVSDAIAHISRNQSSAIGIFGLLGLAWSGSAVFGVLRNSLNFVFRAQAPRPALVQKLVDLSIVVSLAPFFILSIAATSVLRLARRTSEDLPVLGHIPHALGAGWWIASIILPGLVSCGAFFLVYWLVPTRRLQPRHILPGAVLAAVLFEAVKIGFSVYIENFSNYDIVFGSLGAVVAFLFWIYLSANILLLGAELSSELTAVANGAYAGPSLGPQRSMRERLARQLRNLVLPPREEVEPPAGDQH